jgi:hypothetical protein
MAVVLLWYLENPKMQLRKGGSLLKFINAKEKERNSKSAHNAKEKALVYSRNLIN